MRRSGNLVLAIAIVLLAGLAAVVLAQDYGGYGAPAQSGKVETQLQTAITHARNAAGSAAMAAAVSHLGHALNCIEGTRGRNFNASWGHVCQGQGDGILVDIRGERHAANVMVVLEAADQLAAAGVKAQGLAAVQNAARGVAALLQVVADGLK